MTSMDVIRGFARNAAAEGMMAMPSFLESAVHPDCKDPAFHWANLLELFDQRRDLSAHRILPEDIMGVGATYDEVEAYIDRCIDWSAGCLAWGDIDG